VYVLRASEFIGCSCADKNTKAELADTANHLAVRVCDMKEAIGDNLWNCHHVRLDGPHANLIAAGLNRYTLMTRWLQLQQPPGNKIVPAAGDVAAVVLPLG
jgi:hypothetical protein